MIPQSPLIIFLIYLLDYAITVVPIFPPLPASILYPHSLWQSLPLSSCPWVVHISSLASPFPIPFLTSPCLFCAYQLCFLFPVLFPQFSPLPHHTDNPPCNLHFCYSVPILVVCLVCFGFFRFICR